MKAIHNKPSEAKKEHYVGNYKLKYNFESNSQHRLNNADLELSWEL
ncbi:hypothetical protein ACFX5D_02895 [Flavobacterium sp. LB3P45]|uniref:Uncharacterized protein n=1 Tax=Flavobacterium fructosi TaxID=3230416 RepID=A0ABW6HJJ7_9FLAO